jgi:hypothetical protein
MRQPAEMLLQLLSKVFAGWAGYYRGQGGDDYVPVTPNRQLDTRTIHEPVPARAPAARSSGARRRQRTRSWRT